jgi:hypothetical protein
VRAYLRLDPNFVDRKAEYPDGAHRAYIDTLCFAEQQQPRGRFRSRRLLAVLLDKRAKWIPYLLDHGDLVELPTGQLYLDGWDEWQEGDVTVSERMKRLRSRDKSVTPTVTPATVTAPSSGKREAESGKPKAEAGGSNAALPFMGFRPSASLEDIRRQEDEAWKTKCADCGTVKRKHPSATPDQHAFRPELRSVS